MTPSLKLAPPEVGAVVDAWEGPGFSVQMHEGGIFFVTHTAKQIERALYNAGQTIDTIRHRHPELPAWYLVLNCEGLPPMTISPGELRSRIPPEAMAGGVAIVAGSELGAVLSAWLKGSIRPALRAEAFRDTEKAGAWLATLKHADGLSA